MNNRRRILAEELRAGDRMGKNFVTAYLHELEIAAVEGLIRKLEEVRAPTLHRILNSEQKACVDRDLLALRSRLMFHVRRRATSLNSAARYSQKGQP